MHHYKTFSEFLKLKEAIAPQMQSQQQLQMQQQQAANPLNKMQIKNRLQRMLTIPGANRPVIQRAIQTSNTTNVTSAQDAIDMTNALAKTGQV